MNSIEGPAPSALLSVNKAADIQFLIIVDQTYLFFKTRLGPYDEPYSR